MCLAQAGGAGHNRRQRRGGRRTDRPRAAGEPARQIGWEQYCAFRSIFADAPVRERLRELGLKVGLETSVSKVLKVGKLDPEILDVVERYTIPVKEAGQVVDVWKDEARRGKMKAALTELRRGKNERLDAKECFRVFLNAVRPDVVAPAWVEAEDGRRDYVDGADTVLASVTEQKGTWTATGIAMGSAQWQAFAKACCQRGDLSRLADYLNRCVAKPVQLRTW